MKALTSLTAGAAMLAGLALPASAQHDTLFECYAFVHDSCFPGGADDGCGQAYDDALDECDRYYGNTGKRPTPPTSLSARTNPQVRAKIMNSFSAK
jgi:hypothetical protein